jgi:AraC-like DNA-binding protein
MINEINYSIGLIKNTQGDYEEAINIYKNCEENSEGYKSSNYLLYILGLSELYNKVNNIELSEKYIQKGIKSSKYYEDAESYLPYFISNRGKNYFKKHQYKKAIQYLTNNLNIIKKNNDFSNYAENNFYLGECFWSLNQKDKAIEYYKKVDSVFSAKKDIYLQTISIYNRLIEYYKKENNYKKVLFYIDQFIKADKVLDENYKYITNKIAKTYDIQNVIASKQQAVLSLKEDNLFSKAVIITLFIGVIFIIGLFYISDKKKKIEFVRQKEQFEVYKLEREQHVISSSFTKENSIVTAKKNTLNNIDENVITQILNCLEQFEKEQWFLKKEYTVEMLASEFKTNSTYLSKIINEIKQNNFTQYINALRIEYIIEKLETEKKFLLYTTQALSEISGYNSVQTFTRAFTNHTKMKPSYFIKELKNNNLN